MCFALLQVILEKPMAVSHQECLALCELAGSKDRLLAVYQNRRCAAAALTADTTRSAQQSLAFSMCFACV
jgi:predicted dehydrogenase